MSSAKCFLLYTFNGNGSDPVVPRNLMLTHHLCYQILAATSSRKTSDPGGIFKQSQYQLCGLKWSFLQTWRWNVVVQTSGTLCCTKLTESGHRNAATTSQLSHPPAQTGKKDITMVLSFILIQNRQYASPPLPPPSNSSNNTQRQNPARKMVCAIQWRREDQAQGRGIQPSHCINRAARRSH